MEGKPFKPPGAHAVQPIPICGITRSRRLRQPASASIAFCEMFDAAWASRRQRRDQRGGCDAHAHPRSSRSGFAREWEVVGHGLDMDHLCTSTKAWLMIDERKLVREEASSTLARCCRAIRCAAGCRPAPNPNRWYMLRSGRGASGIDVSVRLGQRRHALCNSRPKAGVIHVMPHCRAILMTSRCSITNYHSDEDEFARPNLIDQFDTSLRGNRRRRAGASWRLTCIPWMIGQRYRVISARERARALSLKHPGACGPRPAPRSSTRWQGSAPGPGLGGFAARPCSNAIDLVGDDESVRPSSSTPLQEQRREANRPRS